MKPTIKERILGMVTEAGKGALKRSFEYLARKVPVDINAKGVIPYDELLKSIETKNMPSSHRSVDEKLPLLSEANLVNLYCAVTRQTTSPTTQRSDRSLDRVVERIVEEPKKIEEHMVPKKETSITYRSNELLDTVVPKLTVLLQEHGYHVDVKRFDAETSPEIIALVSIPLGSIVDRTTALATGVKTTNVLDDLLQEETTSLRDLNEHHPFGRIDLDKIQDDTDTVYQVQKHEGSQYASLLQMVIDKKKPSTIYIVKESLPDHSNALSVYDQRPGSSGLLSDRLQVRAINRIRQLSSKETIPTSAEECVKGWIKKTIYDGEVKIISRDDVETIGDDALIIADHHNATFIEKAGKNYLSVERRYLEHQLQEQGYQVKEENLAKRVFDKLTL
ncbi:hypothetical protein HYX12_04010 [Candidatus Woesearchaeota archaeon]|nr:hypothetical protein [Candidatus Woesearchaeota archaeon]